MKRFISLALILLFLSIVANARKTENSTLTFIDKLVIGKTTPSDLKGIKYIRSGELEDKPGCKTESYEYKLTDSDCKELGYNPGNIQLLFYEQEKEKMVLGAIYIAHNFDIQLTGNYKDDKTNKNKILVQTQTVANSLKSAVYKKEPITEKIEVIKENGSFKENFDVISLWKTEECIGMTEINYNNWTLTQKYRDIQSNNEPDKQTVADFRIVFAHRDIQDYTLPEEVKILDLTDKECQDRLDKVLRDAANNVMEEIPYTRMLANDYSYVPEGLKTISKDEVEKYSWIPVEIDGKTSKPDCCVNFDLSDNGGLVPHLEIMNMEDNSILFFQEMRWDLPSIESSRINIVIYYENDKVMDDLYGRGTRVLYNLVEFLNKGKGNYALFQDENDNLIFMNINDENIRAKFKHIDKRALKVTVKFRPPVIMADPDVEE